MPKVLSFSRIGREPLSETSRPAEKKMFYFPRWHTLRRFVGGTPPEKSFSRSLETIIGLRLSDTIIFAGERILLFKRREQIRLRFLASSIASLIDPINM